jgi:UDP-N-acetylmuramyl pentapeptide synthase
VIRLRLSELAAALGCPLPAHNGAGRPAKEVAVESIVTDSRKVDFGALFAALPGSQVDGHDFAPAAVKLGAVALLVERRLELPDELHVPATGGRRRAAGAGHAGRPAARAARPAGGRHHRQQRQDHRQGNGRQHPAAGRAGAVDPGQLQQ